MAKGAAMRRSTSKLRVWLTICSGVLLLILVSAGAVPAAPPGGSPARSTVGLVAAVHELTVTRQANHPVNADPFVYVGAVGGTFQLDVSRDSYASPLTVSQVT